MDRGEVYQSLGTLMAVGGCASFLLGLTEYVPNESNITSMIPAYVGIICGLALHRKGVLRNPGRRRDSGLESTELVEIAGTDEVNLE